MKISSVLLAFVTGMLALSTSAAPIPDLHWPSWRGPASSGSTTQGRYAATFGPDKHLDWKIALPDKGCSTPVVWGQDIFVTSPVDGKDAVLCYDWSGKEKWRTVVGRERRGKHRNGSGSNPSAAVDGDYIFVYFKSGNLAGLDYSGKLLWSMNLQELFGKDTLYWDIGTSPVVTSKHVVIAVMHGGDSFVAAYDKATGKQAWLSKRNYDCPVEGDHSYATPHVIQHQGREAVLVWGAEHLTAHDAATGKLLWSCAGFNPKRKGNWVQVASGLVAGNMAIIPYGRGSRLAGIQLGGEGDVTATHRSWTREDTGSFVPTPALYQGRVYLLRDRGEVVCLDPKTGQTAWTGQLPKASSSYYASPVVADGKLYATREDGMIFVADIREGLKVLAENHMGERMIASPVPVGDRILLRGEKHLFCVAKP